MYFPFSAAAADITVATKFFPDRFPYNFIVPLPWLWPPQPHPMEATKSPPPQICLINSWISFYLNNIALVLKTWFWLNPALESGNLHVTSWGQGWSKHMIWRQGGWQERQGAERSHGKYQWPTNLSILGVTADKDCNWCQGKRNISEERTLMQIWKRRGKAQVGLEDTGRRLTQQEQILDNLEAAAEASTVRQETELGRQTYQWGRWGKGWQFGDEQALLFIISEQLELRGRREAPSKKRKIQ